MNLKKAKSLRKLVKAMVEQNLVTPGASYERRTFTRQMRVPAANAVGFEIRPIEVYTSRLMAGCEKGTYRRMKKANLLASAA